MVRAYSVIKYLKTGQKMLSVAPFIQATWREVALFLERWTRYFPDENKPPAKEIILTTWYNEALRIRLTEGAMTLIAHIPDMSFMEFQE